MSNADLTVRFPVIFGPQRDRPRKNVKVVEVVSGAPAPEALRTRRKRRRAPAAETPPVAVLVHAAPGAPTSRTARSLALATLIQRRIDAGQIRDHAHAAELLGMTAVNVGYIMNLLHLAADIQEALIMGELVTSERSLREVARALEWEKQAIELHR